MFAVDRFVYLRNWKAFGFECYSDLGLGGNGRVGVGKTDKSKYLDALYTKQYIETRQRESKGFRFRSFEHKGEFSEPRVTYFYV